MKVLLRTSLRMPGRLWPRAFALAVICALLLPVPAAAQSSISRDQELAIGRYGAAQLMTRYQVVPDAEWLTFLGSLRDALAPFSGRPDMPAHQIVIVEDEAPNAASLPGFLFFTTGLLRVGMDRDGFAFVMAHELAHTAKRHVAANVEKARGVALLNVLVTVVTGVPIAGDLAEVLARISLLGFAREMEVEADAEGLRMMTEAGFTPEKGAATLRFFNEATARRNEKTHWAGTHPGWGDRITRIDEARKRQLEKGIPLRVTYFDREAQTGPVVIRVQRLTETARQWLVMVELENKGSEPVPVPSSASRLLLADGQSVEVAFLESTLGAEVPGGGRFSGRLAFDRREGVPASLILPLTLPSGQVDATLSLQGGGPIHPKPQSPKVPLPRPPAR